MKRLIFALLLFISTYSEAQHKVRFELEDMSAVKRSAIYIAGSFNNWDSTTNQLYQFKKIDDGSWILELNLAPGKYEYKYTGGGWNSVEKQWDYDEVQNHVIDVKGSSTVRDTVAEWRDLFVQSKTKWLSTVSSDTNKLKIYAALATAYAFSPEMYNTDSALQNIQQAMQLLQKIKVSQQFSSEEAYNEWLIVMQQLNASVLHALGNYTAALQLRLETLKIAEKQKNYERILEESFNIMREYDAMKDYRNVQLYCRRMIPLLSKVNEYSVNVYSAGLDYFQALSYFHLGVTDSALFYARRMLAKSPKENYPVYTVYSSQLLGDIFFASGNSDSALYYYPEAIRIAVPYSMYHVIGKSQLGIAKVHKRNRFIDSALYYVRAAIYAVENHRNTFRAWGENAPDYIASISLLMAEIYKEKNQTDSAYKYLQRYVSLSDSLNDMEMIRQFQNVTFNENLRQEQVAQQAKQDKQRLVNRIKIYSLVAGFAAVAVLAFVLFRNNRNKQRANLLLQSQKRDIEKHLAELKNMQAQLVQSEKMASLGELTAGIAHEIQNPLNFVNNFSELNKELLAEMNEELKKGNYAHSISIAKDVMENEEKVAYHGKRAEAIVKSMLQHSRLSTGKPEMTDINTLVDEYLRLAYHGLRARDKTFNAKFETDFDPAVVPVNLVPQDMGRVILNLINNAFYAVTERKKMNEPGFEPTVLVRTKKLEGNIQIRIKDNGMGIPQHMEGKIFQPFFTTKPTGQGTGLGLSLSYDIVKAHGGEINVKTIAGKETEFTIILPV